MNEYISKEAVVRYLKEYSEKECNSNSPYGMITSSVLNKAERALSEMPASDIQPVKWISVKDRLPEIIDNTSSEAVLIHLENGEQYVAILIGEDNENRIEAFWSTSDMHRDFECDVVTHWQPLPESPKYGGAENG